MDVLRRLSPHAASWFASRYDAPSPAQALAWPVLARGDNLLLASPTGSGKTLAAFLGILAQLHERASRGTLVEGIHCVYVSPLKALTHDVARNLESPRAGFCPEVRVGIRTGDTSRADRERLMRAPPHVLVTTPESAALLLASKRMRAHLAPLRWLVVDEVHALAGVKRGAHLALTLERLARHAVAPPTRVGLSATVAPLERVATWLCGALPCEVREAPPKQPPEIDVVLAPRDEDVLDHVARTVARSRTTIVFAPTRAATERLTRALQERLGDAAIEEGEEPDEDDDSPSVDPAFPAPETVPLVAPHHGSMSKDARLVIEERLKRQEIRCVVTSSSLELGVHLDGVDEVVLVGSPKSVARAVQRVGRAGHHMHGLSRGTLLLRDVDEVPEALALRELARARRVEEIVPPDAPLDVLAQHLAALAVEGAGVDEAFALVRRASCYQTLARETFDEVLGTLDELVDVTWSELSAAGPRTLRAVATQGGVIPDAQLVKAYAEQRYVGELDEAFVAQLAPGDKLQLAGETWRFAGATGLSARLAPARGQHPTVPEWRAEGISASPMLAEAAHNVRTSEASASHAGHGESERLSRLQGGATRPPTLTATTEESHSQVNHALPLIEDRWLRFQGDQRAFSALPPRGGIGVESIVDDDGARAAIFHHGAGRRVNDALARALAHRLAETLGERVRPLAADEGFALLAPRSWRPTLSALRRLMAQPLEADLRRAAVASELLKRRFRHVAFRGLALRYDRIPPGERQRAANMLLARLLRERPEHPLLREAWREVLEDALDARGAEAARARVAAGDAPLVMLPSRPHASPMGARILVRDTQERRAMRLRDHDERVAEWIAHATRADAVP